MSDQILDIKMLASDAAQFLGVSNSMVSKYLKNLDLEFHKSHNKIFFGHETAKDLFKIKFKKKVISFQIVKGGTGKTSITHSFAIRANLYGAKVLCIDIDQQGNLSQAFNINAQDLPVMIDILNQDSKVEESIVSVSPGLDLIPSRLENAILDNFLMLSKYPLDKVYANIVNQIHHKYDLILIDCPPALGQSVTAATLASDLIIAPVTPEKFSLSGLRISYEELHTIRERFNKDVLFKIILNKFNTRTALSTEVFTSIFNDELFRSAMCNTFIRACQEFPNTIYSKSNIFATFKNTSAKEDIDLLTREILDLNNLD